MESVTVRPYREEDRLRVERICMETAGPGFRETERKQKAAAAAFCRYFITHSPETCFVAVAGETPVGYILCAPSYGNWCRYVHEAFGTGFPLGFFWSVGSLMGALPYIRQYPAHLHINLLAPYQRMGLGRQLMEELEKALRQQECPGVSLCVSKENRGAMAFYESCGFRPLGRHPGAVAYGKRLK